MIYINEIIEDNKYRIHIYTTQIIPDGIRILYSKKITVPDICKDIILTELDNYIKTSHPDAIVRMINTIDMP